MKQFLLIALLCVSILSIADTPFVTTTFTKSTTACTITARQIATTHIYYVSPDALVTGTGTRSSPWTLETAVANAIAGDIVYVLAGNYGAASLTFPNSGTAAAPIHFIGCTAYPSEQAAGQTDISILFPLASFKDFKEDAIENYPHIMPLLDGVTRESIALNIGNKSYINIQNFAITRYQTGVQTSVAGRISEHIHLKNIIGSDFDNNRATVCGCEVISSNCPQKLGYGLEIYGNNHLIEHCIMADASAYNIAVWGSHNTLKNCKSYGTKGTTNDLFDPTDYYLEIGGYNDLIGTGTVVDNCIAIREDGPTDLCHKGKGIGIKRGQQNTITNCTTTDLDNEGFYVFGQTTTGNIFKNCQTNDPNRDGNALSIREGAHNNSFIDCTINNAAIAVRFKRDGGGHHNLFYNCFFNRPSIHIQIDQYGGCAAWTNCLINSDCDNCETNSQLSDNLFLNCLFLGARNQSPAYGIFTVDNQVATPHNNKIVNSIFYQIPSFRACTNGVSLNNPEHLSYSDTPNCANNGSCCPDFESAATIVPAHFEIYHSIFNENGFNAISNISDFTANENQVITPQFIDVSIDDFHLTLNSPAIDAGTNPQAILSATLGTDLPSFVPSYDYEGTPRGQDCKHDIGLYEYPSTCTTTPNNNNDCSTNLSEVTYLEGNYIAKTNLRSSNQVAAGKTASLFAGECITLEAGFHAQSGATFLASIKPCATQNFQGSSNTPVVSKFVHPIENTHPITFNIFPNPFSSDTQIMLKLPTKNKCSLHLLDNMGRPIQQLLSDTHIEGQFHLSLNGNDLQAGMYWLLLQTADTTLMRRVVLIK